MLPGGILDNPIQARAVVGGVSSVRVENIDGAIRVVKRTQVPEVLGVRITSCFGGFFF
jgi:hypothetical protein